MALSNKLAMLAPAARGPGRLAVDAAASRLGIELRASMSTAKRTTSKSNFSRGRRKRRGLASHAGGSVGSNEAVFGGGRSEDDKNEWGTKDGSALTVRRVSEATRNKKPWWVRMFETQEARIVGQSQYMVEKARAQAASDEFLSRICLERSLHAEFSITSLHVWMLWNRLRGMGTTGQRFGNAMFDFLWESCIADLTARDVTYIQLGKHLSEMQQRFYGNASKLDEAIRQGDEDMFVEALKKNVYVGTPGATDERGARALYEYMMEAMAKLEDVDVDTMISGRFEWGLPRDVSAVQRT